MNDDLRVANYDAKDETLSLSEFSPDVNADGKPVYTREYVRDYTRDYAAAQNPNTQSPKRGATDENVGSDYKNAKNGTVVKGESGVAFGAMRVEDSAYFKNKTKKGFTAFLMLAVMLIITATVMAVRGSLIFAPIVIAEAALVIPITFTYTLKLYNKIETFDFYSVLKLIVYGAACYIVINGLFRAVSAGGDKFSVAFTAIRCVVEIAAVLAVSLSISGQIKNCPYITVMLSAACAAGGFSIARCITEGFNSMFINVNVYSEGVIRSYGAIINEAQYAYASVYALALNLFEISVFRPLMFTLTMVISAFIFQFVVNNKQMKLKRLALIPFLLFLAFLYSITELKVSSTFFKFIYTAFALFTALYSFVRIMSFAATLKE